MSGGDPLSEADLIRSGTNAFSKSNQIVQVSGPSVPPKTGSSLARARRLQIFSVVAVGILATAAISANFVSPHFQEQASGIPTTESDRDLPGSSLIGPLFKPEETAKISTAEAPTQRGEAIVYGKQEGANDLPKTREAAAVDASDRVNQAALGSMDKAAKLKVLEASREKLRLHGVVNGVAVIEASNGEMLRVEPGENLGSVGRVVSFKRRGKGWIVITTAGLIDER